MNIQIKPETTALNPFVFRAADRMRIDGCANAIAREGLSLALYCPFEPLLDHYLNLLLAKLRQEAPEHRIEVYFPANTDSLLDRFNEVLARQSLDEAVKAPTTIHQAQIWIVHDAQTLPDSEIQLLARLIQNFPGANIRAVLLMTGSHFTNKTALSAFGRKILRWDIEAPTDEQAQAALDLAQHEGNLGAVQQLLQRIRRKPLPELDGAAEAPLAMPAAALLEPLATGSVFNKTLWGFHKRGEQFLQAPSRLWQNLVRLPRWMRDNAKLSMGVAAALVLSTLMMLWIQPEAFGLPSAKKGNASAVQSQPLVMPAASSPPVTTPAAVPLPPVKPADAVVAPTPSPSPEQVQAKAPVTPMATTPEVSAIEAPEASQEGIAWVKKLDRGSFLLQHGMTNSYAKILLIQSQFAGLKEAHIVPAYRPGEKLAHFVIVTGPFEKLTQGYEASKSTNIPKSWVRTTASLQDQLNPSTTNSNAVNR